VTSGGYKNRSRGEKSGNAGWVIHSEEPQSSFVGGMGGGQGRRVTPIKARTKNCPEQRELQPVGVGKENDRPYRSRQ